jgi:glutamine synthetase
MDAVCSDLLAEVRAFRQRYPEVRYVDLISLDIPGISTASAIPWTCWKKSRPAARSSCRRTACCWACRAVVQDRRLLLQRRRPGRAAPPGPGTLKPVTWEAQPLGQMLITSDGTEKPIEFEPREVLAQVLDRLARKGIHPVVAFELEFYLFDKKLRDGLPQFPRDDLTDDADDQPNMHIERLSRFAPVLDDMVEATRARASTPR